jgi:hypothetical protein
MNADLSKRMVVQYEGLTRFPRYIGKSHGDKAVAAVPADDMRPQAALSKLEMVRQMRIGA